METYRVAIILAAGLVLAAFLNGGIYQFANGGGSNYRLNRFTGQIVLIQRVGPMSYQMLEVNRPPWWWEKYFFPRREEPAPPPPPPPVNP
jgi:hypothetical protein